MTHHENLYPQPHNSAHRTVNSMSLYNFIPLTKGQQALVDGGDYDRLMGIGRWCYSKSGYAVHYYVDEHGRRKTLYMHRVILTRALEKAGPGMQVDHINHNKIDNRRANLRLATRQQNQAHKRKRSDSTSPFKGVTRNTGRWEARIKYGNQRINLGRFKCPEEAAKTYDAASLMLYGDFAGTNFREIPPRPVFERVIATLAKYGLPTANLCRLEVFLRSR